MTIVKQHIRKNKSGKVTEVRAHVRTTPTKPQDFRKRLEEKYKKEVLFGATYIDSRQRNHFRKWVKAQNKKKMRL